MKFPVSLTQLKSIVSRSSFELQVYQSPINNAEGSGSATTPDFRKFLFIARKSAFECASMLMIFRQRSYLSELSADELVLRTRGLCKMIVSFSRTLKG